VRVFVMVAFAAGLGCQIDNALAFACNNNQQSIRLGIWCTLRHAGVNLCITRQIVATAA
jgi:hypothetical protein